MEGQSEPTIAVEKVKYLCGEDEDTLPDRFGDRAEGKKEATVRMRNNQCFFLALAREEGIGGSEREQDAIPRGTPSVQRGLPSNRNA